MATMYTFYNFVFFSLFGCTTKPYKCPLFFLIYINNKLNHIVSTIKQLVADDIAHNANSLIG